MSEEKFIPHRTIIIPKMTEKYFPAGEGAHDATIGSPDKIGYVVCVMTPDADLLEFEVFLEEPTLEYYQHKVGGWIELVRTGEGRTMYVNEEGRLNGLPVNAAASEIAHPDYGCARFPIVGTAVVLMNWEPE